MENFIAGVQKGHWLKVAMTAFVLAVLSEGVYAQSLEGDEVARRSENALLASELVKKADSAYNNGSYKAAHEDYRTALGLLSGAPAIASYRDAIVERYANAATELSRDYMRIGKKDEARSILTAVLEPRVAPSHAGAKKMLEKLDDPIRYNPAATLQHAQDVDAVAKSLRRAEGYLELGVYDKALIEYEEVLQVDSHNVAARRGMEKIHSLKSNYFNSAYDEARSLALMQVEKEWETPLSLADQVVSGATDSAFQEGVILSREDQILDKLRNTVVPIVDLEQVSLEEVRGLLEAWSQEYDTQELDSTKKGINVIMDLGDPNTEEGQLLRARSFNLELTNIPMEGLVQYISEQAGLSWRAGEYALEIRPVGAFSDEFITRSFKVPPRFLMDVASDDSGEGNADPFEISGAQVGTKFTRVTAKEYLEKHGVDFSGGTSVSYIPSTNTVTMTNTPDNLDILEQLVDSLTSSQDIDVIIKVIVVDVEQSNLEELGFDWLVSPAGGGSGLLVGGSQGNGGVVSSASGTALGPVTSGLRSGDEIIPRNTIDAVLEGSFSNQNTSFVSQRAPGVLGFTGEVDQNTVQMLLSGLSQKKANDRVSQLSTITRSGEKAVIAAVREFPYPEEYEPPELPNTVNSTGSSFPVTPATPTSFTTKGLGITMEVEPIIGPNKQYISLRVNPELRDFDGYINYGSPISDTTLIAGGLAEVTENAILMPVFSIVRSNTSVSVSDGSTIAIGGLMKKNSIIVNDKVPILGDLPVIGRLFQRQGTVPETRAIVIFVTAELVDPTGARINR